MDNSLLMFQSHYNLFTRTLLMNISSTQVQLSFHYNYLLYLRIIIFIPLSLMHPSLSFLLTDNYIKGIPHLIPSFVILLFYDIPFIIIKSIKFSILQLRIRIVFSSKLSSSFLLFTPTIPFIYSHISFELSLLYYFLPQ